MSKNYHFNNNTNTECPTLTDQYGLFNNMYFKDVSFVFLQHFLYVLGYLSDNH